MTAMSREHRKWTYWQSAERTLARHNPSVHALRCAKDPTLQDKDLALLVPMFTSNKNRRGVGS